MTEPHIKIEGAPESQEQQVILGTPEPESTLFLKPNEPAKTSDITPKSQPNYTWKQPSGLDQLAQVHIREKAAMLGLVFLRELEFTLKNHSAVPSAAKWVDRIKTIKENRKECRILIGFLGSTGAGKSSMINALLEQEDLLPADDEKACTAVCVEISWNPSDDPREGYVAIVERISENDWRIELEKLLQDVSDQASNKDGDDGEPDLERDMRIKAAFQKLRCVYPHIKTLQDLQPYTVQNLLNNANVKDILGKRERFIECNREKFAALIKPFIDSSNSKQEGGKSFAQWPLVKVVYLQMKSRVLQEGIILVDLPGSMDTNAARGAIAETYQKNLSVTCVVAPTARAASDKPAQDLLGKVAQRTLQLDNRFSADHLCFVVSKTDSSLLVERYIRTHPGLEGTLADETAKGAEHQGKIATLEQFCMEKKVALDTNRKKATGLNRELKNFDSSIKKIGASPRGRPKRKRNDDKAADSDPLTFTAEEKTQVRKFRKLRKQLQETKDAVEKDSSKLVDAGETIKQLKEALDKCESRKRSVCIAKRNEVSSTEIRRDFETAAKQLGRKAKSKSKPLQVFCVSSWAFSQLSKGDTSYPGFPRIRDTGIPALQQWLGETTLPTRDRNALAFLEDVISLDCSMRLWLEDTSEEFKMTGLQRNGIEDLFDGQLAALKKALAKANSQVVTRCETMVNDELFSKMAKAESIAGSSAERIVKGWAQKPMHWGTHRALNREHGTWTTWKGVEIKWNDDLGGIYLEMLLKDWTKTLHQKLPTQRTTYNEGIEKIIQKSIRSIASSIIEQCPELAEAIQQWKESSLRTVGPVQKATLTIFNDTIQETARDSHRLVQPKIMDSWVAVYDQCAAETGPGHYKRNQLAHVAHVQKVGRTQYRKCSVAIRAAFKKMWESLPEQFGNGTEPAVKQIGEEFRDMLANYTLRDEHVSFEDSLSTAKAQLQETVRNLFVTLKSGWVEEPEVIVIEDEVEDAEEEISIEHLLKEDSEDEEYAQSEDNSSTDTD